MSGRHDVYPPGRPSYGHRGYEREYPPPHPSYRERPMYYGRGRGRGTPYSARPPPPHIDSAPSPSEHRRESRGDFEHHQPRHDAGPYSARTPLLSASNVGRYAREYPDPYGPGSERRYSGVPTQPDPYFSGGPNARNPRNYGYDYEYNRNVRPHESVSAPQSAAVYSDFQPGEYQEHYDEHYRRHDEQQYRRTSAYDYPGMDMYNVRPRGAYGQHWLPPQSGTNDPYYSESKPQKSEQDHLVTSPLEPKAQTKPKEPVAPPVEMVNQATMEHESNNTKLKQELPEFLRSAWAHKEMEQLKESHEKSLKAIEEESKLAKESRKAQFELRMAELEVEKMDSMLLLAQKQMASFLDHGEVVDLSSAI